VVREDFLVELLPKGYFLYYKGHFVGGDGNGLSFSNDNIAIHKSSDYAEKEIADIIAGKGNKIYMAVINYYDKIKESDFNAEIEKMG